MASLSMPYLPANWGSMGQFFSQETIHPGAGNGTEKGNDDDRGPGADQCIQGARTSTCECPSQAKYQPTVYLALIEFFWVENDLFPVNGLDPELFYD